MYLLVIMKENQHRLFIKNRVDKENGSNYTTMISRHNCLYLIPLERTGLPPFFSLYFIINS